VILSIDYLETPIGLILIAADSSSLCSLTFFNPKTTTISIHIAKTFPTELRSAELRLFKDPLGITSRLNAWFKGELTATDTIPVNLCGTEFRLLVWSTLSTIQAGTTITYSELATRIGQPWTVRAVGKALNRNPVCIVVPCHRVISANGSLAGYSWGYVRKRWLIEHEHTCTLYSQLVKVKHNGQ
jgi:methylated-DNA-[protein]-cysteine S-methyltransferase